MPFWKNCVRGFSAAASTAVDNDVVDRQLLSMEMDDAVVVSLSMEMFSNDRFPADAYLDDRRRDRRRRAGRFGSGSSAAVMSGHTTFRTLPEQPFHAGADLYLDRRFLFRRSTIPTMFCLSFRRGFKSESHRICYEADAAAGRARTIRMDE